MLSWFKNNVIFVGVLSFVVAYYFISFNGFYFYDDLEYSKAAFQITQGNFDFLFSKSNFDNRIGFILPISFFYFLFGVNDFSTTLISLLSLIGIISLAYFSFIKENIKVAQFNIIFIGLEYYLLLFSTKLYPDLFLGFLLFSISLFLFHFRYKDNFSTAFIFSGLLFWAFLVKLTFLYALPFYGILFLYDFKNGLNFKFWYASIIFSSLFFVCYGVFYWYFTDDFWYLFTSVESNQYASSLNFSTSYLLKRMTYTPVLAILSTGMGTIFIFFVFQIISVRKYILNLNNPVVFWTINGVFSLAMLWFMTTSLQAYSPILLMGRMFFGILPFLAISASYFLIKMKYKFAFWIGITFVGAGVISFLIHDNWFFIYLFLGFIALAYSRFSFFGEKKFLLMGFTILLMHPFYSMIKKENSRHRIEKEMFLIIQTSKLPTLVITDERLVRGNNYFYKYNTPENLTFIHYRDFENTDISKYKFIYYLVSKHPENFAMEYPNGLPMNLQNELINSQLILNKDYHSLHLKR